MRKGIPLLVALFVAASGCISIEDNGTPAEPEPATPPVDIVEEPVESEPEPAAPAEIRTGGDAKEDVVYSERTNVASFVRWTQPDHHFRVLFTVNGAADREVRLTIDVGEALNEGELRWIGPGMKLAAMEADPRSVVLQQLSGAGQPTATLDVEALQANNHAMELAFHHIGGSYALYFDDVSRAVPGGVVAEFPDAEDATGKRTQGQWQGNDLWGLAVASAPAANPGSTVQLTATVTTDGRDLNRQTIPLTLTTSIELPSGWVNGVVTPAGESNVSGSKQYRADVEIPEGASGTHTVLVKFNDGINVQTASYSLKVS